MRSDEFDGRPELVRKRAVNIAMGRLLIALFIIWLVGTNMIQVWDIFEGREQRGILVDCTSPGGECYERGQERTGEAVGNINRIVVLAAACADRPGAHTVLEIERCIKGHLEGR